MECFLSFLYMLFQKGGGTIDLEPCLSHTSAVEPTLAPVVVERTMTTRAAASVIFFWFSFIFPCSLTILFPLQSMFVLVWGRFRNQQTFLYSKLRIFQHALLQNALRQQRFVREVTIQYNLCNEPWYLSDLHSKMSFVVHYYNYVQFITCIAICNFV